MSFVILTLGISLYLFIGLCFDAMFNNCVTTFTYILLWPLLVFQWLIMIIITLVMVIFGMFAIIAKSIWYYIPIAVKLLFDTFGVFRTGGKRNERT